MMFKFFMYIIILFITGFIAIYALSNGDSILSVDTLHFSLQSNVPFLLVLLLCTVIGCSFLLFFLYWLTSIPMRMKSSRKQYLYRKSVNEIFDLLCDLDTESEYKNRMKKFNVDNTKKVINHPIVELADYKLSSYVQNKERHARALARIKNNNVLGPLFYKEMILSKIHADEYEDARTLVLEFMKQYSARPIWFYKTAIFVFSYLGDVSKGKDLINRAKKAGAIEDYALEMSNLYLNKAKILEKEGGDKSEMLKLLIDGLEYDSGNQGIIKVLHQNIAILKNHKKAEELLKSSWIESASYEILDILSYLEPHKDDADLRDKITILQKKNSSDSAKLSLAKFVAIKGAYSLAVEILKKVHQKENNQEYDKIQAFLEIIHSNHTNKEKLEILKKQML